MPSPAYAVRIVITLDAIRQRFASEKPAVRDDEWDAADYLQQRARAYLDEFAALDPALRVFFEPAAGTQPAGAQPCPVPDARCTVTSDAVFIEVLPDAGSPDDTMRARILGAVRHVFDDAGGWRRSLLPHYFARHRAWRAATGSPIHH